MRTNHGKWQLKVSVSPRTRAFSEAVSILNSVLNFFLWFSLCLCDSVVKKFFPAAI